MNSRFKNSKRIKKSQNYSSKINKYLLIKTLITIILTTTFFLLSSHIFSIYSNKVAFEKDIEQFHNLNSEGIFHIDSITLYHSATAKQNAEIKKTFVLDIYQFTDISFHITNIQNTIVKEFYIDNISYSLNWKNSNVNFSYKNPLEFGKLINFNTATTERIDFAVLDSSNDTNFSSPYVYNNLSSPITLEYVNKKVAENFNASLNNQSIEYNGKLLKIANINLDKISGNIYFNVNIMDTNNNFYTCRIRIPINLTNNNYAIYNGELLENINTKNLYSFLQK